MWIDELEDELPNGFHDSVVRDLSIDFSDRKIVIVIDVDVSDVSANGECVYRRGSLQISDFGFCNIEQPCNDVIDKLGCGRITSTGVVDGLPRIPCGYLSYYFYFPDWNSFVKLTGKTAVFVWLER